MLKFSVTVWTTQLRGCTVDLEAPDYETAEKMAEDKFFRGELKLAPEAHCCAEPPQFSHTDVVCVGDDPE